MNMLSVIKTAIITIVISFISGVLLDYYKNYAPRIVCTMMKIKSKTYSSRNIKVYSLIIKNISNKTLHNLNINLQGDSDNLKMEYTRITKGLKYDIEHEGRDYDVGIPFLGKGDEFRTKIFMPIDDRKTGKPIITLRSPEDFKEINSYKDAGAFSQMINSLFNHKKVIISIMSVLIVVYIGILGGEYYVKTAAAKINTDNSNKNITLQNQNPATKSDEKTKSNVKKSSGTTAQNKNISESETKNTSVNENQKNSSVDTDKKNEDTNTNQNNTEKQKGDSSSSSAADSTNKTGSTDNNNKQTDTSEKTPSDQNNTNMQSSGSDNSSNAENGEKPADGSGK